MTVRTYYESRRIKGFLSIVNPTSAHPEVGNDALPLDEDHFSIAKPRDNSAQVYSAARDLLKATLLSPNPMSAEVAMSAPATIARVTDTNPLDVSDLLGGNHRLTTLLADTLEEARRRPWVVPMHGHALTDHLRGILSTATRDVETRPTGQLFTRLIQHGPEHEESPFAHDPDRDTGMLTDVQAEQAVEFVRSHMVNQFKGQLAELLALRPVIERIESLFRDELSRGTLRLYTGESIRQSESAEGRNDRLAPGADGLLLHRRTPSEKPKVAAIVEVKANRQPFRALCNQLHQHRARLSGTLLLEEPRGHFREYRGLSALDPRKGPALLAVVPSRWRLSRNFTRVPVPGDDRLQPRPDPLPAEYPAAPAPRIVKPVHRLTLAPSVEELEAAGFAMTFWYMQQAARAVGIEDPGQHRLRHMLYCLGRRPMSDRLRELTARLYNIYNYSYALSADSRVMLWPEDFPPGATGVAPKVRYGREPKTYELDSTKGWKEKEWEVRQTSGGRRITFERTLRKLAPNLVYDVGFHVGTKVPVTVEAGVGHTRVREPLCRLNFTRRPGEGDPPCPFPWDDQVFRANIGSRKAKASEKGAVVVRFVITSQSERLAPRDVCRLITAFNPADDQEAI